VLFAVAWVTSPSGTEADTEALSPPARLLAVGLGQPVTRTVAVDPSDPRCEGLGGIGFPTDCPTKEEPTGKKNVSVDDLRQREWIVFGSAALVVLLVGAGRRAART